MTTLIETRVDEAAGWILLNNTRRKNAINYEMYDAMFEALDRFEKDERVRAVVVSGNGGNFSAGFDVTQGSPEPYRDFVRNVSGRLSKRLWYFPKPTIAAVEGYCIGGGFELAMGADLVYTAEDAVMGEPEIDFFYIPDFNSIPCISLPRKAKEMIMLGLTVSGREAVEIGFANRAFAADRLLDEVSKVCRRIAALPVATMTIAKQGLNTALDLQGFANAIDHGEEMAAYNSEANKSNPDCLAFHEEIEKNGLRAALQKVRAGGILNSSGD